MSHRVYIALGSNLGDRWGYLSRAIEAMRTFFTVDTASTVYETAPWGYRRQPDFLNMVVSGRTALSPSELLSALKEVERALGRRPTIRYGPRVIDLDILFYDRLCLQLPDLILPHPRLHERAFVLVPLADLAPDLPHPCLGKTVRELLQTVSSREDVRPVWPHTITFPPST